MTLCPRFVGRAQTCFPPCPGVCPTMPPKENFLDPPMPQMFRFWGITQNNSHYAVQGHSRSPISIPMESVCDFLSIITSYPVPLRDMAAFIGTMFAVDKGTSCNVLKSNFQNIDTRCNVHKTNFQNTDIGTAAGKT